MDKSIEKIENDGYQIKRNEMPDFSTAENTEEANEKDFPLEDLTDEKEAKKHLFREKTNRHRQILQSQRILRRTFKTNAL